MLPKILFTLLKFIQYTLPLVLVYVAKDIFKIEKDIEKIEEKKELEETPTEYPDDVL